MFCFQNSKEFVFTLEESIKKYNILADIEAKKTRLSELSDKVTLNHSQPMFYPYLFCTAIINANLSEIFYIFIDGEHIRNWSG